MAHGNNRGKTALKQGLKHMERERQRMEARSKRRAFREAQQAVSVMRLNVPQIKPWDVRS